MIYNRLTPAGPGLRKHEWNPFNARQEMGAKKDQVKNCPENGLKTEVKTEVRSVGVLTSHSQSQHSSVGIEQ